MINYDEYRDDEDFMTILNHLRYNCLDGASQVSDATDLDPKVVSKHFNLAQAIVAEEIDAGDVHDEYGASLLSRLTDWLHDQKADRRQD